MRRRLIVRREKVFDIEFLETLPTLVDGELILKLRKKIPADHGKGFSPCYSFEMVNVSSTEVMGGINFRIGVTHHERYFRGNIGFNVHEEFRGHHYASRSCRLLLPIAAHHELNPIWLTCDVDNYASRRSIELAGAEYVETVTMPDDYPYAEHYPAESRTKRRYMIRLDCAF